MLLVPNNEKRQLPSLAGLGLQTPPLSGLGLDPSLISGLAGQATAPLAGLGLGGLAGAAGSLPGQLTSNPAGTLTGVLGSTLGTVNGLPIAGPLLGQVEGLTGLNGLLGQAGSAQAGGLGGLTGTVGGLASAIPIGNLQQALLAQAVQIQQLERLVQQAGLPVNLPPLPATDGLLKSAAATVQNPSLTNVANTANKAINTANSAVDGSTDAATAAWNQAIGAANTAAGPAGQGQLPNPGVALPKAQAPTFTDTFTGANQALNPLFQAANQGLLTGNAALNGINIPTLPNPPAALGDLTGQLNGLAGQIPVAGQAVAQAQSAVAGVQSQAAGVVSTAQGATQQAVGTAQGALGSVNSFDNAAQAWAPPPVAGALDPVTAAWQAAAAQLQQAQQGGVPFIPTGKVLASVPGQDDSQQLTPGSAARAGANAVPGLPDPDVPRAPGIPDPIADAEAAVNSDVDSAESAVLSVASSVISPAGIAQPSTAPPPIGDGEKEYGSMTHLVPPLTADPTRDNGPTDAAFYTSALPSTTATGPAPTGSEAAAAPAAPTPAPPAQPSQSAPAAPQRRKRALPDVPNPQAPPAPADSETGTAVADQAGSQLQPLAPNAAPFLQQYVDGYQPPASPADSFVSAWSSVPLPSAPIENLPTPIELGGPGLAPTPLPEAPAANADAPFAAFIADHNAVKAVSKSAPSPAPGWSQDTDYSNGGAEAGDAQAAQSGQPSPTKARIQDPVFSALNTPPAIPARSKLRLRRQILDDVGKTGKDGLGTATGAGKAAADTAGDTADGVFTAAGRIRIDPHHAQQQPAGPPQPPANWSQDTDYAHLGDLPEPAPAAAKAKTQPKAAELLQKRHRDHDHEYEVYYGRNRDYYRDRDDLEDERRHSRDWSRNTDSSRSFNSSGKGGRPPMLRQKAYETKDHHHHHKEKKPAPAPAPASPAPEPEAPAADPPAEDPPAERLRVRFAKVRRDGLDSVHEPPAGEHGQPPSVPGGGGIGAAPAGGSAPADESSASSSEPTHKSKGGKKKGSGGKAGDKKKKNGKKDKDKKKDKPAAEEPAPASSGEEPASAVEGESAAEPAQKRRRRRWTSRLSFKRWL